jgi:hypothetical protein
VIFIKTCYFTKIEIDFLKINGLQLGGATRHQKQPTSVAGLQLIHPHRSIKAEAVGGAGSLYIEGCSILYFKEHLLK